RGTAVGDRSLIETAEVLRETFRGSDPRARLEGGEVVVLAVRAPEATASLLLSRLEEALTGPNAPPARPHPLAPAGRLARYGPERPCSLDDMLFAAKARLGGQVLGQREPGAIGAGSL